MAAGKPTPIGKDHEWQLLPVVEIADCLCCFEGGIRIPDTTSLLSDLLRRVGVRWISGHNILNGASLNSNDTDRNTAKASATYNHGPGPSTEGFLERVLVEKPTRVAIFVFFAIDEPSHIVDLFLRWVVGDIPVPIIRVQANWQRIVLFVWYERHPLHDFLNTLEVVVGSHMRDTVLVHNLRATKLEV